MKVIFNKKFLDHNIASRYEGRYRIDYFSGKYDDVEVNGEKYVPLVHSKGYMKYIKSACMNREKVADVQLTPETYEAAKAAVGLSVLAAVDSDFAVVRPPGHHAGKEKTSGFCIYNNLAIAAQYMAGKGKRVLLIDIDGHHGDGTQSIFYDSNKVFFTSIHQMHCFPFTGSPLETGIDKGRGYTVNIPITAGSGDKDFLRALESIIRRVRDFRPQVVGVSAGFDGYYKDPLLELEYTLEAYYQCGYLLRRSFRNIFAVLEGGYHGDVPLCIENFVKGINDGTPSKKIFWNPDMSIG
ncbi:MAG: hypothetical protein R6T99_02460 [Bacteroidales bacterium]